MLMLVLGVALWSVVHLYKSMGHGHRAGVVSAMGEMPYKGVFSLLIVASLVLIVMGWKSAPPTSLWLPPVWMRHITLLLVPIAVILFISARAPTDLKQVIRHPQMVGVKLWALAHLLANGEVRSIILFGGLLAWAVLEVIFINKRDGAWVKPPRQGALKTTITVVIGLALSVGLMMGHRWFTGVPIFGAS